MEKFEASFESLLKYQCPKWYTDAKLGFFSHWGPQSVPMYGDWYARNMYMEGSPQYLYHLRHYGHPSKFGYKDICALWKAENFQPDELMGLYVKAGAKFFFAQASHHDHFFNYPSKLNRFNSTKVGPMKDICGLWKQAAENYNIPFGLQEHIGASFSWWAVNKMHDEYGPYAGVPYDGCDKQYADFYHDNYEHVAGVQKDKTWHVDPWYTGNKAFRKYWLDVMNEIIGLYQPDLLFTDGPLPFGKGGDQWFDIASERDERIYKEGLEAVARLYNASIEKYGENRAVYTQKDRRPEIYRVGVLDIEKSQLSGINPDPWQTDTCVGNWYYDVRQVFKRPGHIIEIFVDIISKNGNMMLNILQRPDGTIDDEQLYILKELAKWNEVCREGVYGTKPWKAFGEGPGSVVIDGFKEDEVEWGSSDYRFTCKDGTLYAFMMRAPENGVAVIKSLTEDERVKSVRLLGAGALPFAQSFGALTVKLPVKMPTEYANCLAVEIH